MKTPKSKAKPYPVGTIIRFKHELVANQRWNFEGVIVKSPDKFRDFIPLSYKHEMSNKYKVKSRRIKTGKMYILEVSHYQIEKVIKQ